MLKDISLKLYNLENQLNAQYKKIREIVFN